MARAAGIFLGPAFPCRIFSGVYAEERRRIIDVYMERFFRDIWIFAQVSGLWFMDAESVRYFSEKYGVQAICICRDQWGTDGYNLWGRLWPRILPQPNNMFVPAQTEKEQIKVPVFRMLGSDPICQYDLGLKEEDGYCPPNSQGVCTMEPIYPKCGGDPQWVNWFYQENFNSLALPFGYVQAGQENAFGWAKMKDALPMQWDILKQRLENREVELQLLSETVHGFWNSIRKRRYSLQLHGQTGHRRDASRLGTTARIIG